MSDKRMAVALQLRRAIELLVQNAPFTETESLAISSLYETWTEGVQYVAGTMLKYGEDANGDAVLYTVLQAHKSQSDWRPDKASPLFKRIGFKEGVPIWVQPLGAADAYMKGDIVSHNGATWVSDVDNNVWPPGVYGWTKQSH